MRRMRSVRRKVLAVVIAATLAALAVSVGSLIAYDLRDFHRRAVVDMTTQAELVGHMTAAALAFDDARLASENLALLRLRRGVRAAAIYNANGTRFAAWSADGATAAFPLQPEADNVRIDGDNVILFRRIVEKGEYIGTVFLRAEYGMTERAIGYASVAALIGLLALGSAVLLARRLDRVITAPILEITGIAREVVATRDYSRRAPRTSADEVADLVDSFNAMLTEIEQRTTELEDSNRERASEIEQRTRAQQEVMRLNEGLEQRVHERTLQLELANAELAHAMDEAHKANQAKSSFLSSMSHELRTPLNAILGFSQILTSDALPTTPEQKKEFANHILKSGRHLLTLINEILDLSKVESGAVALSLEPVALADIVTECRGMVEPLATPRNVRVLFPERCPYVVRADRTRLKQVLLNLLSNAIKYNRDGGAVVLDAKPTAPDTLRISVQDTGHGLSQEQLELLFQPFNRLGQEGGTEEGTGIGLVVTKRLVDLMGGTIGVTSSVGVGSVFWIELPLTETQRLDNAETPEPAPPPPAHRDSHTILYVEDNPANLKLVQEIVRYRPDLRLLSAPDGNLGIELAKAHLPDLIVMDLNLPGVSGIDAFRELRAHPRTAHIPVIALTANAMPRDVERGLAMGFSRYLTKPINIDEFTEAIDSTLDWLDRRREGTA